jgi:putative ATPase
VTDFLFDPTVPLAARMRPTSIEQYVGQTHLMGEGKPLRKMVEAGHCSSMIFWGPPGTGKTTLATLIAQQANAEVITLSAVTSGVKDIRAAIETAQLNSQYNKQTVLFVDEVHRFNKSQQDAFLPYVEDGTVAFIGATTENPSFALNNALLSRARTYLLKPLNDNEVTELLEHALTNDAVLKDKNLNVDDDAFKTLIRIANGDGRKALHTLELASDFTENGVISVDTVVQASGEKMAAYDNKGDDFYDLISAFHKSVRGSDPNAALYWYARILVGGGDPLYVARRLLAIVSEDIGTADPKAMQVALNAWDIFHRVGPAEGERAIAEACVYCALAPKSNALYVAYKKALSLAKETGHSSVPNHLRNAPTKLMKSMDFGKGYRYAHNEPGAYAAGETYFPDDVIESQCDLYQPNERGFEKQLSAKMAYLRELDQRAKK